MSCGISLGDGSSTELFFKFSTDPRMEPKTWCVLDDTVFESNVAKISFSNYRWTAPNLFNKVPKTDRGYKETYILSTAGSLKLNAANDDSICIENVDDSKNKYLLKNGKLQSPIFLFT